VEPAQLIAQLACLDKVPVEAILAARADRARVTPIFIETIDQYVSGKDRSARDSIFFIFHLLGEWREKSAYRPLARLLRCPRDDLPLGGAVTETSHRVMAAVFDGDPGPLYEVILDPDADEFVRALTLDALAMATLNGELPRDESARFLRKCHSELLPQDECYVWNGWQEAIAWLGLAEFKPLVQEAFARGFISPDWTELRFFEEDFQAAIKDPAAMLKQGNGRYTLFGDTIEELSWWYCFNRERERSRDVPRPPLQLLTAPAVSPRRKIGRNDPCPCGSGKKFKKCCLTAAA
jgi:uncharacterized protein